ncbi:MAG: PAS domain S-box protein [Bacteroidetes bacterium]|nr:PAS domain S-box protein [Bacteroidota bacterium]
MNPAGAHISSVMNHLSDVVLSLNTQGSVNYINKSGKELLHLSEGDDVLDTGKGVDLPAFMNLFRKALQSGKTQQARYNLGMPAALYEITCFPATDEVTALLKKIHPEPETTALHLRSEKELSDTIINSLPGIFYMADTTPRLLRWNKTLEQIAGYTPEELGSIAPIELFDTRDHPAFKESMARVLTEGKAQAEARLISKEGTITPFYFTGVRILYEGKTVVLGTGIDLTEQKNAAEEIRFSAEGYYLTALATNDMIWDWNLHTDQIWWNKNYNKLFGYPENNNQHTINSWVESIHEDDRERVAAGIYLAVRKGEKFWADEYRCLKQDGTLIYVNDRGYISHNANGEPVRMIGSMQDITERIRSEEALREKEERYRNLFERASDSIVVHNMEGVILDMNFAAEGFSGYSREQLRRMNLTDLLFAEDLVILPIPFEKLKAGATTISRRRVKTRTGVIRIMEVSSRMLPDGNVMAILRDVTEKSEAERALRNSELRFRALASNVPVGIFETDTEGQTTYVNDKMLEYTGVTFDELMKTGWLKYIHPDDRTILIESWQHRVKEKEESTQQYRIVSNKGDIRWVQGKAIPIYDKNGTFNGYLGTVNDITKEKLAQIALIESEEKYRTLVEQASDAIYIVNEKGRVVTVNPSACRLSGYSEEELLQMNILDFVFAGDLETKPFRFDELKQGKTVTVERRLKIKENKTLEVECIANMLSDGRILVFARDITERIRIRNEILKEKNFSDAIINSLPGIFYLYDDNGQFIRWNKNFEYISGYTGTQISEMHPLDFFDDTEKELIRQRMEEVFRSGKAEVEAHFYTISREKIPYYFNGWRVIFDDKPCLIGVGIDITEKKKNEQLLLQSYEDIRRLASHLTRVREDERKRIGREIHDELGQQLTAIKMDMAWIDKRTDNTNELIKNKIKNVITLLDGGNKSVRRILTELSPGINDNHGLLEALERLNHQFESTTSIPVEFVTTHTSIQLSQDIANCIFRVYQESLTNIMKYAEAKKVESSLLLKEGQIVVKICDDGKGFDTQGIPAKTSFGLLGMKERVLSQHGKFELRTAKGKGTCITITVPCRE